MKVLKGEKYIYLAMAVKLCLANQGSVSIGSDSGLVGGQSYYRYFQLVNYEGKVLLKETKTARSFADFTRYFEVINSKELRPTIIEYITESNENASTSWVH